MQYAIPQNHSAPPDLANEISLLVRAGCTISFRPGYGLTLIEVKVSPAHPGLDGASEMTRVLSGEPPTMPFTITLNIVTDTASIAKALRNARWLTWAAGKPGLAG